MAYNQQPQAKVLLVLCAIVVTWSCMLAVLAAGVRVTFIDANHCPGAAQVLFELQDGRRFIHCGDMRYSPALLANPHLQRFRNADAVFLDTTYAHPRHAFPEQVCACVAGLHAGLVCQ